MLLSDRDLKAALDSGRLGIDPLDPDMVQPSSIDVRLDRFFRVFANHRYSHIDPSVEQEDLTELVEAKGDEPFVLHPGEFVLGSTFEVITLGDDLASRLEGKALAWDTVIWTTDGPKEMADIVVGDHVFDPAGKPVRVVATSEVMLGRSCYEVVFRHGERIVADADHQWATVTKVARQRGRELAVTTTAAMATTLAVGNEHNHHIPLAESLELPEQDLPIDPYVLGVWLGDGTSTTGDVTTADVEVVDQIRAAGYACEHRGRMRYGAGSRHDLEGRRDVSSGRFTSDDSFTGLLRRHGLLGNKHVPECYLRASKEQRLALLQGLMDSDGYCDVSGRCEFVSTREVLAEGVHHLAASLGLRPTRRKKTAYLNGVDCGPAFQVKFVPDRPVFRLTRKLARQRPAGARLHRHHAVADVRPVAPVPVRCLQVDSADGLFLAGWECIPTHNSSLGRIGLLTHSTAGFIDPGFSGHVTLELGNVATLPILLYPGMKIGQVCVFQLSSPAEHPYGSSVYGSRYQGQRGPTPSRSWQSFHRTDV